MKIKFTYSHLNGLEWLLHHHPNLWDEIHESIKNVDAASCKTKKSKEKTMRGKLLFAPKVMNAEIKKEFEKRGWSEERYTYYVTDDQKLTRDVVHLPSEEQKRLIGESGAMPIPSYHQTDFVKNRVSVEVQFGKYPAEVNDEILKGSICIWNMQGDFYISCYGYMRNGNR